MTLPEPVEFVEFLAPYPVATQTLARALRQRLVEILPPCVETIWDATNTVGPSYGFTEKNADHFIHLPAYTNTSTSALPKARRSRTQKAACKEAAQRFATSSSPAPKI